MRILEYTTLPSSTDGNIFTITGKIGSALRQCGRHDIADEMRDRVMEAGSYSEALRVCASYIDMSDWAEANGRDVETMEEDA